MTDNERLFRIIWPDGCWHRGWKGKYSRKTCPKCGKVVYKIPRNPRFAHSDEIAAAMMEKGLWEEFVIDSCYDKHGNPSKITFMAWTSLLMDAERLKKKIIAWREGK